MNFYIKTLGCKVNQAESDTVFQLLYNHGHSYVKTPTKADIIIINTCTVTHIADRKSRQIIRKLHNENPLANLIITGCSVENTTSKLPEIGTLVKKNELINYLSLFSSTCSQKKRFKTSKTRKNLLVQNGCNYFCSYCIIPFVRNSLVSYSPEQILQEAKDSVSQGIKELVLTGINLGLYNHNNIVLTDLIKQLLQINGSFRIRLGSIEPNLVSNELLSLINSEQKLCPHLHLPLQGATDSLLKIMQRKYTLSNYLSVIEKINNLKRLTTVTTDIIVGHPGETEDDFNSLLSLLNQNIFLNVHLFDYSMRQGTTSAKLANHVPQELKRCRVQVAQKTLKKSHISYLKSLIGKNGTMLIEKNNNEFAYGHTEHYVLCATAKNIPDNSFLSGNYHALLTTDTAEPNLLLN